MAIMFRWYGNAANLRLELKSCGQDLVDRSWVLLRRYASPYLWMFAKFQAARFCGYKTTRPTLVSELQSILGSELPSFRCDLYAFICFGNLQC